MNATLWITAIATVVIAISRLGFLPPVGRY